MEEYVRTQRVTINTGTIEGVHLTMFYFTKVHMLLQVVRKLKNRWGCARNEISCCML